MIKDYRVSEDDVCRKVRGEFTVPLRCSDGVGGIVFDACFSLPAADEVSFQVHFSFSGFSDCMRRVASRRLLSDLEDDLLRLAAYSLLSGPLSSLVEKENPAPSEEVQDHG